MLNAKRRLHAIFSSSVVPRPIAFVSTISATGVENLAPFRRVPYCSQSVS